MKNEVAAFLLVRADILLWLYNLVLKTVYGTNVYFQNQNLKWRKEACIVN